MLGGRTVAEWQAAMSSEEFTDWQAFFQVCPFGPIRGDMQAAIVASTMANIHAKKNHKFTPKDFMPEFRPKQDTPAMTPEQIMGRLGLLAGGH